MAEPREEAIKRIRESLHCTEAEAQNIWKYDYMVDHTKDEDLEYDLTEEQQKIAQKFAKTGTRQVTTYNFTPKNRKPNVTKEGLIAEIAKFLKNSSAYEILNLEIPNSGRMITFEIGDEQYSITLIKKNKNKK